MRKYIIAILFGIFVSAGFASRIAYAQTATPSPSPTATPTSTPAVPSGAPSTGRG